MADVILFGSANTEEIVVLGQPFLKGAKVPYAQQFSGVGGSAVNWSFWLYAAGYTPLLFCPIGDDPRGRQIEKALERIGVTPNPVRAEDCEEAIRFADQAEDQDVARDPGTAQRERQTRHSYIIVHEKEEKRTVLSDPNTSGYWLQCILKRTDTALKQWRDTIRVAMIGNIPSEEERLESTKGLIESLKHRDEPIFIYVNPGRAQINASFEDWRACLEKADVFQFGLEEAKAFVRNALELEELPRLHALLEQFVLWGMNTIITLGRGGAVASFPSTTSYSVRCSSLGRSALK